MRYLVVSSDAYNTAFGDGRVIAVEVDPAAVYEGAFREQIVDAGTAHLDRLTWVATPPSEAGAIVVIVSHRIQATAYAPDRLVEVDADGEGCMAGDG